MDCLGMLPILPCSNQSPGKCGTLPSVGTSGSYLQFKTGDRWRRRGSADDWCQCGESLGDLPTESASFAGCHRWIRATWLGGFSRSLLSLVARSYQFTLKWTWHPAEGLRRMKCFCDSSAPLHTFSPLQNWLSWLGTASPWDVARRIWLVKEQGCVEAACVSDVLGDLRSWQ